MKVDERKIKIDKFEYMYEKTTFCVFFFLLKGERRVCMCVSVCVIIIVKIKDIYI